MQTTIELPDELGLEAKRHALENGTTLRQLVIDGLRKVMQATPEKSIPTGQAYAQKVKTPLFVCEPDAPASNLSIEALIALQEASLRFHDLSQD